MSLKFKSEGRRRGVVAQVCNPSYCGKKNGKFKIILGYRMSSRMGREIQSQDKKLRVLRDWRAKSVGGALA